MYQQPQLASVERMNTTDVQGRVNADSHALSLVWRLGLITACAILIWYSVPRLTTALWGAEAPRLLSHISDAVGAGVLGVALVLVFCRYIDRRPVSSLGLNTGKQAVRDFVYGTLTWLIPAAVGVTTAFLLGWLEIQINSPVIQVLGVVLLLMVLVFVYEAFPEELLVRGYIYRNLSAAVAPWIAMIVQALLFSVFGTALWVIAEGWDVFVGRSILFFVMGLVIGSLRVISGSVWAGMGFHVAFQVAMQLFLSSSYVDITVNDADVFTMSTAGLAFIAAAGVAALLWRGTSNWTKPEPITSWTRKTGH